MRTRLNIPFTCVFCVRVTQQQLFSVVLVMLLCSGCIDAQWTYRCTQTHTHEMRIQYRWIPWWTWTRVYKVRTRVGDVIADVTTTMLRRGVSRRHVAMLLLLLTSSNCAQYTRGSNITVRAIHVRADDTETKSVFSHTAAAAAVAAVAAQFVLLLFPNVVYSLEKFQSNLYTKRFATKKPPQLSSKIPYAPLPAVNHTMPAIRWKSVLEIYPRIKQDKSATITIACVKRTTRDKSPKSRTTVSAESVRESTPQSCPHAHAGGYWANKY